MTELPTQQSKPAAAPAAVAAKKPQKPKAFVDRDNCTGCEICIQFCPVEQCIIKIPEPSNWQLNGYVKVMENKCIGCRLCVKECPWDAISMVLPGTLSSQPTISPASAG